LAANFGLALNPRGSKAVTGAYGGTASLATSARVIPIGRLSRAIPLTMAPVP